MHKAINESFRQSITCCVTLEFLSKQGTVSNKISYKNGVLRLIRNEFRDIFIELVLVKGGKKKFQLKDINVRTKFINEGKASISFSLLNMTLLICNAPPANLRTFLKTMYIKLSGAKTDTKLGFRTKLSNKHIGTQEISPVTVVEILEAKVKVNNQTTPTSSKRAEHRSSDRSAPKRFRMNIANCIEAIPLNKEQNSIFQAAMSGKSIFFTGSAGTGKSYLLRRILDALPPDVTVATASTGVAACHIGGITLHAFAGIGSGYASLQRCFDLASRFQVMQLWRKCRHLIIDEISMVDGNFFEKLEHVARAVRKNDRPFGGIQLIICGDFFQLPPVGRDAKPGDVKFCFQTEAWNKCINLCFELRKVHRQVDQKFIDILQNIRIGRVTPEISEKLLATSKHKIETDGVLATRLCSHMRDANVINNSKMEKLEGQAKIFYSVDSDFNFTTLLDQQTPVESKIQLKVGAQIMLMKNLNISEGLVNGARGVVKRFNGDGMPVVWFCAKREVTICPEKWSVKTTGGLVLSRKQIPVRLAWAFSIHKSQGLTLDCVEMSLSRVFEAGQAYVALSRAKSFETLRILDFNPKQVWANTEVLKFYKNFRRNLEAMEVIPVSRKGC